MPTDLPLRCRCGAVRGVIHDASPRAGIRLVCACVDCQAYAHFLGRPGDILDAHGGTDLFQTWPARVRLTEGSEHLTAAQFSPKGPYRWYTACCNTPVANTMIWSRVAFASVLHSFVDHAQHPRDEVLGPVFARIQTKYGHGNQPAGGQASVAVQTTLRAAANVAWGTVRGQHQPSPFFNPSGEPVVQPTLISREERAKLKAAAAEPPPQSQASSD